MEIEEPVPAWLQTTLPAPDHTWLDLRLPAALYAQIEALAQRAMVSVPEIAIVILAQGVAAAPAPAPERQEA